jgi:ABC-type transport system involved in multi-copper enzyme maturation permease subunit
MTVFLIAANFLRENRWPTLLLLAWIVLSAAAFGAFSGEHVVVDDLVFYVRQQALYIVVFSAFLASTAIYNERRSRRILMVLSKPITRGEYLLSLLTGSLLVAVTYGMAFGLCGTWLARRSGVSGQSVWLVVIVVMAASALSAAMSLFFSTFLNPFVATAATALVFAVPATAQPGQHGASLWSPGLPLLYDVVHFGFTAGWRVNWPAVVLALLETVAFWGLATLIFARRDIAVAVE